jgi:Mg-chelatase subunit ChlI
MTQVFPLPAIVGQKDLKIVLLMYVVSDAGSLVIIGNRGTGKTTAASTIRDFMDNITVERGCRFNCPPKAESDFHCPDCGSVESQGDTAIIEPPFIMVPHNISKRNLRGYVVKEGGKVYIKPGLLGKANRGVLFLDRINLFKPSVVKDIFAINKIGKNYLLDDNGKKSKVYHTIQFKVMCTIDIEDGQLMKELFYKIDMLTRTQVQDDIEARMEITRRMMEFNKSPDSFVYKYRNEIKRLEAKIDAAKELNEKLRIPPKVMQIVIDKATTIAKKKKVEPDFIRRKISKVVRSSSAVEVRKWAQARDVEEAMHLIPICFG